jgi:hypothetical protein
MKCWFNFSPLDYYDSKGERGYAGCLISGNAEYRNPSSISNFHFPLGRKSEIRTGTSNYELCRIYTFYHVPISQFWTTLIYFNFIARYHWPDNVSQRFKINILIPYRRNIWYCPSHFYNSFSFMKSNNLNY